MKIEQQERKMYKDKAQLVVRDYLRLCGSFSHSLRKIQTRNKVKSNQYSKEILTALADKIPNLESLILAQDERWRRA